jgi:HprK-related kinase A
MRHEFAVQVGPVGFRVGSEWRAPVASLQRLYEGYPPPEGGVADFSVRLEAERPWRRWMKPSVAIRGDYVLPDAAPLALAHGLLAAEMGMNLQMALGQKRYLLLHASAAERDGKCVLMTGASGSGKSTLAAMLGEHGWRFMGDEFALLDPETWLLHPFPRAISLKNRGIHAMEELVGPDRFGPWLKGTPKGTLRHLRPRQDAIARMGEPARPALILFPTYGADTAVRPVGAAEVFVRLTQASTNYVTLGERGFGALSHLVTEVPARAIDYPDGKAAMEAVEALWAELS